MSSDEVKPLRDAISVAARRCVPFVLLWWALAGAQAWSIGIPAVLGATGISVWLAPRRARWRWWPALRFLFYFLIESLTAGFDVALRVFSPRPRVMPAMVDYRLQLPAGPARVLFACVVSLVPGTLCAEIEDEHLRVHVLDVNLPIAANLLTLEQHVGAIFGFHVSQAAQG